MKKALIYALALAFAFSLTACGQPKTEQPTDPAPSTSAPEPIATPEPIKDTAPEPEPEQTPAAPVETEDTQPPEETEPQEAEQVQLFTEVNETVYATGTVNLRSGPSTAHDKVGSLNKSDSVTRVGIGTADAEGWSRIQLSDGSTVYVSNKYLSTTKPVVQQQTSKPSGGSTTTQQQTGGNQQQTGGSQQQTGSTQKIDGHDDLGDYILNGKGGKYYPALGITLPVSYNGQTHEGIDFSQSPDYKVGVYTAEEHTEAWNGVTGG